MITTTDYFDSELRDGECTCCSEQTRIVPDDGRCPDCIEEEKFINMTMQEPGRAGHWRYDDDDA